MQERGQLADIKNLYVYSSQTNNRVPLLSVAKLEHFLETGRIARREHFRTISILCYPQPGVLASEVIDPILPKLQEFQKNLPPGLSAADRWRKGQAIRRLRKSQNRSADFFDWDLLGLARSIQ